MHNSINEGTTTVVIIALASRARAAATLRLVPQLDVHAAQHSARDAGGVDDSEDKALASHGAGVSPFTSSI